MSSSPLDPILAKVLSLPPSASYSLKSLSGGSGFTKSFRLTISPTSTNTTKTYFLKTSPSSSDTAETMFLGESTSLNAISSILPSFCPKALGHGQLEKTKEWYLLTEWIDFSSSSSSSSSPSSTASSSSSSSNQSLAQKLAILHTTPAPIPAGFTTPQFGFPVSTCCGDTPQDNTYTSTWAQFFGQRRLLAILERCEERNGSDRELRTIGEGVVSVVVPRLLGQGHLGGEKGVEPVLVHGDLWSGNHGIGCVGDRTGREEVVFDPSASYSHSEFEIGIMKMFGGFGNAFWDEYHSLVPKTEPVEEYDDRVALYRVYHGLNHYAIFGGGYRAGALAGMRELLGRYGNQ